MASLTKKRDCKNWIACFTLPDGTRTNRSTGTRNRKLAKQLAIEYEQASQLAKQGQLNEVRARKVVSDILEKVGEAPLDTTTVESFLNEWVESKDNEGTKDRYRLVAENFLQSLGKKSNALISNITYRDVQRFIKSRQEAGLASKTVLVDSKALNTAFTLAKRLGHTQHNPVDKALAAKPLKAKSSEKETFSPEQVSTLLNAAEGEWKTVIMLGYFTGARLEDCAKMLWDNVNFERKIIDFVASKSSVRAVIPMTNQLETHLDSIASTDDPNPHLCPNLSQKVSGGKTGLSMGFKEIMDKAGVDPLVVQGQGTRKFSKLSFHSLRHSFNSLLANEGIDQETRMKLVGQKSKAINTDYTHLDMPKLEDAMSKLPALKLN